MYEQYRIDSKLYAEIKTAFEVARSMHQSTFGEYARPVVEEIPIAVAYIKIHLEKYMNFLDELMNEANEFMFNRDHPVDESVKQADPFTELHMG